MNLLNDRLRRREACDSGDSWTDWARSRRMATLRGVRLTWLKNAWGDFQASADPDELVSVSHPVLIASTVSALVAAIMGLAYVPALARVTQLQNAWEICGCFVVGGLLTYAAYRHRCRGTIGSIATLFDNAFYSGGLALAATSCAEATGIALAVIHGLMVVSFPARDYAITWLFSAVMTVPVVALMVVMRPALPVGLVLVASLVMMHIVSQETRVKRRDRLRQLRLEQALGAADKLADESVQAALTTTLLTLGHFLHELRNYQTAIAANLEYVEAAGDLAEGPSAALSEAQNAQRGQADLLRRTIEDLRGRSSGGGGSFMLRRTIQEVASAEHSLQVLLVGEVDFEIQGNAEHFRVILLNLFRNAGQAGSRRVHCALGGEASGTAVRITISDDGKGILAEKRDRLFDSFALSDKPGGSGLGLYLIRRYVELLGGSIRVGDQSPLGGASFVIRLPARAMVDPAPEFVAATV